jgi:hypothetical protein
MKVKGILFSLMIMLPFSSFGEEVRCVDLILFLKSYQPPLQLCLETGNCEEFNRFERVARSDLRKPFRWRSYHTFDLHPMCTTEQFGELFAANRKIHDIQRRIMIQWNIDTGKHW